MSARSRWLRLLAAATVAAAVWAAAQAPTVEGRPLALNGRSLTAFHLSGSPVVFGEARQIADGLGLDYARGSDALTFTLGTRTVTVPLAESLQRALGEAGLSVDGRPLVGTAGAVSDSRVLAPLQPLALAFGASFSDDGKQVRVQLPAASFKAPLQRVTGKEADRVFMSFSRPVNYRSALDGDTLVVTIPGARGDKVRYSVEGGSHIKEVLVGPASGGFEARLNLPASDGYRVWAVESGVVVEVGPALKRVSPALEARQPTVVLDPGHGGDDPGASGGGLLEKDVALDVADAIKAALTGKGVLVTLTRQGDTNPSQAQRGRAAAASDAFVSLHASSLPGSSAAGVTVYYLSPNAEVPLVVENARGAIKRQDAPKVLQRFASSHDASVQLADAVSGRLVGKPGLQAHVESRARLGDPILGAAPGRAILVDVGWLSSAADQQRLSDPTSVRKLGEYIAAGLLDELAPLVKAAKDHEAASKVAR